jgi:hypothetical protein
MTVSRLRRYFIDMDGVVLAILVGFSTGTMRTDATPAQDDFQRNGAPVLAKNCVG